MEDSHPVSTGSRALGRGAAQSHRGSWPLPVVGSGHWLTWGPLLASAVHFKDGEQGPRIWDMVLVCQGLPVLLSACGRDRGFRKWDGFLTIWAAAF